MIDQPPATSPGRSWALVCVWSLGIFTAVPLARSVQEWVAETVGRDVFLYVVVAVVGLGVVWAIATLVAVRGRLSSVNLIGCVVVGGFFAYAAWERRTAPEEALHFVQYGVLGILVFRASSHSIRDSMIYVISFLICVGVGLFDEILQWLMPGRFFEFRDVWMNASAAALSQVGIAVGLTPSYISWRPAKASGVVATNLSMSLLVATGLCASNTPASVEWYAQKLPWLEFLTRNESIMNEFGHLHEDAAIGRFYSRLTLAELGEQDRTRATEAARILDAYREPEKYVEFLQLYTAGRDPFLHEARVHLFSRDWHVHAAETRLQGAGTEAEHWTIAYRENQILETYFPETLEQSSYRLTENEVRLMQSRVLPDMVFTSRTSAELVTGFGLSEIWLSLAALSAGLAWMRRRLKASNPLRGWDW